VFGFMVTSEMIGVTVLTASLMTVTFEAARVETI
jgi:hypothetical protein